MHRDVTDDRVTIAGDGEVETLGADKRGTLVDGVVFLGLGIDPFPVACPSEEVELEKRLYEVHSALI